MQNKVTALKKLQTLLYQKEFSQEIAAISSDRKFQVPLSGHFWYPHNFQVGNMNRNEKIRTYNFARQTVTDHRLGESASAGRLAEWLQGRLGFQILERFGHLLREEEKSDRLMKLLEKEQKKDGQINKRPA
jgi:peptide chain release factor 1